MKLEDTFKYLVGGYYGIFELDEYSTKEFLLNDIELYITDFVRQNWMDDFDYIGFAKEIEENPQEVLESPKKTPIKRVDETLADMKGYTKTLVYEELNLGNLIEQSIKTMMNDENKEEDEDIEEELLTLEDLDELKDEDFEQHGEFLEDEQELDEEFMRSLIGEEE